MQEKVELTEMKTSPDCLARWGRDYFLSLILSLVSVFQDVWAPPPAAARVAVLSTQERSFPIIQVITSFIFKKVSRHQKHSGFKYFCPLQDFQGRTLVTGGLRFSLPNRTSRPCRTALTATGECFSSAVRFFPSSS